MYETVRLESWDGFRELVAGERFRSWAFRGQADASWPLFSSLSRYLLAFEVSRDVWKRQEERIIRIFKRKAHLFLDNVPADEDSFQWLALMQHHGAPTRMLDLTWSPYVAAFFALERSTKEAAVWAFHAPTIMSRAGVPLPDGRKVEPNVLDPRSKSNFEQYFLPGELPVVFIGEPYVMNQRLIAQSGTFVMPGVLDRPIEDVLGADEGTAACVAKFVLPACQIRKEAMREMYNMNITQATLFPDLDGLARSMAYELEFHWAFDPYTGRPVEGFRLG